VASVLQDKELDENSVVKCYFTTAADGRPDYFDELSVVRKQDIYIAKNYLTHDEIDSLNRLTVLFLDSAELRVKERRDLTRDLIGYVKFSSPVAQAPNARLGHIYET